jgi:hypothetical protein
MKHVGMFEAKTNLSSLVEEVEGAARDRQPSEDQRLAGRDQIMD